MLTKHRLMYVTLAVRDLSRSRQFYEEVLGLPALDPDDTSVSYPLGHVVLTLIRTSDPAVPLGERDRSLTLTLLVDDMRAVGAAMDERGGSLRPAQTSRAGTMADLYDPDGHWLCLYEASEAAMSWPSGGKIRALRRAAGDGPGLELLYVFLYVHDLHATEKFYQGTLGLVPLEVNTCHRGVTAVPDGVVKYDAGGVLLTTHHVGDAEHAAEHRVTVEGSAGVALGFHTADLDAATTELSSRGLAFTGESPVSPIGVAAGFADPGGHRYYLCQPSAETMARPSGAAIQRILRADL
ncbi:VOC family protein [Actinoplanes aureus]|uniref:VOC family protein n=1 Tax=Actinoplanes aureus TaxID=2792083 RepID=A0A931CCF5_9ACTN|nr:VOC family protein [Actinoplanes aureus]MBG0566104.1 VOC family protein [Actinoplanes aureus]